MDSQTTRKEVDRLVGMYRDHKAVTARQVECGRQLAKAKLRKEDTAALQQAYDGFALELQVISDTMTYASPSIWVLYKYEAYADEAQPIRTIHDFRVHCSKPGYICTKRFQFVNAALVERDKAELSNAQHYPDGQLLDSIVPALAELEADEVFMAAWRAHEYYTENGRVAKWENV